MPSSTSILGKGIKFPFTVSSAGPSKTGVEFAEGEDKVYQSIRRILGTPVGSRVMRRDFGSRIHDVPFEPQDAATEALIKHYVIDAINRWEPRVNVTDVSITMYQDTGKVEAKITIRFIKTNRIGNLVYPFYITSRGEV